MERYVTLLIEELRKKQEIIKDTLANGHIKTMEQYREEIGRLDGLALAAEAAQDTLKKIREY